MGNNNDFQTRIVNLEIRTLTPEEAAEQLEKNYYKNRLRRKSHRDQIVSDMKNGLFNSMNGQTILIDRDGILFDGQHRLEAQAEAGVTIDWVFVTVDDGPKAWMSIDNTARRTLGDLMRDKENASNRAALVKFAYAVENGEAPLASTLQGKKETKITVTRADGYEYDATRSEMVTKALNRGMKIYWQLRCGGALPYTAFCFLIAYLGEDEFLDDFVDDASSLTPDSKTVIAMQKKIARAYSQDKNPDRKWLLGVLLDAYDHFRLMDDSVELNKMSTKFKKYDKRMAERRKKMPAAS